MGVKIILACFRDGLFSDCADVQADLSFLLAHISRRYVFWQCGSYYRKIRLIYWLVFKHFKLLK